MRSSRVIAAAASAFLALSTMTTNAGLVVIPPPSTHHGHFNATPFWIIFGCAGSVVLAALAKNASQRQQLTQQEAMTCGLAYWLNPQNYH